MFKSKASLKQFQRVQHVVTAYRLFLATLAIGLLLATPACANEHKSGIGLGFVQMQKLWQGLVEKPRMTTCRLATQQTYKKKQICVYQSVFWSVLDMLSL